MIKKSIFITLAIFGLSSFADMQEGTDYVSNVVSGSDGESGFMGSISFRGQWGFGEQNHDVSYRARLGWTGDVNEEVQWGVVLSSHTEQGFTSIDLHDVHFEQAYVSYSPVEGFSLTAGKKGWVPDFHKIGVLYSEQIYPMGVMLKYKQEIENDSSFYAKVKLYNLDDEKNDPLAKGTTLKGKLGGDWSLGEEMKAGVYVSALYDGLFNKKTATTTTTAAEEGDKEEGTKATTTTSTTAKTLAQAGFHISASSMAVPVGLFGIYLSDVSSVGDFKSYTAGVSVGNANSINSVEMGEFGLAVSYYDINDDDFTVAWMNEDYVKGAGNKGVAVRAQYNPWDNTNLVAKYARGMGEGSANSFIGELTYMF